MITPYNTKIKMTHWIERATRVACVFQKSKVQKHLIFQQRFIVLSLNSNPLDMEKQKQIMNAVAENYVTGDISIFFTQPQLLFSANVSSADASYVFFLFFGIFSNIFYWIHKRQALPVCSRSRYYVFGPVPYFYEVSCSRSGRFSS